MQKRVINLGKTLVKELQLEPGVDTLARWMAHYLAEQLTIAKKAKGVAKSEAEQKCFETILKLWQHRSYLPNGSRPFENFEPIFRSLERLDPENITPYFYTRQNSQKEGDSGDNSDVQIWLDIAQGIDQAARVWLEYVFRQAALSATDKNTFNWLENAVGLPSSDEISVIVKLYETLPEKADEETAVQSKKIKQEKL